MANGNPNEVNPWGTPGTPLLPSWVRERFQGIPLPVRLAKTFHHTTIDELDADWFEEGTYLSDSAKNELARLFNAALHNPAARSELVRGDLRDVDGRNVLGLHARLQSYVRYSGLPPLLCVLPAGGKVADLATLPLPRRTLGAIEEAASSEEFATRGVTAARLISVQGFGEKSLLKTQCVLEARYGLPRVLDPQGAEDEALLVAHAEFLKEAGDLDTALGSRRERLRRIAPTLSEAAVKRALWETSSIQDIDYAEIARSIIADDRTTTLGESLPVIRSDETPLDKRFLGSREGSAIDLLEVQSWSDLASKTPDMLLALPGVGSNTVRAIIELCVRRQPPGQWVDPRIANFDQWEGPIRFEEDFQELWGEIYDPDLDDFYPPLLYDATTAMIYAVFRDDDLLWVGTTPEVDVTREKTESLEQRLRLHANGDRSQDRFSLAVFDYLVLPSLKRSDIKAIVSWEVHADALVRDWMRQFTICYLQVPDLDVLWHTERELIETRKPRLQTPPPIRTRTRD